MKDKIKEILTYIIFGIILIMIFTLSAPIYKMYIETILRYYER